MTSVQVDNKHTSLQQANKPTTSTQVDDREQPKATTNLTHALCGGEYEQQKQQCHRPRCPWVVKKEETEIRARGYRFVRFKTHLTPEWLCLWWGDLGCSQLRESML